MRFFIRVYDNFLFIDGLEVYDFRSLNTFGKVKTRAKKIVDIFLVKDWKLEMEPNKLSASFLLLGDDPLIRSNPVSKFNNITVK